jgi:3-deoxy-D-manno-octulosonic-acid transferase
MALPLLVVASLWRAWRRPAMRVDLAARLALRMEASDARPVWLHAASVGEVRSLAVLVGELHRRGHAVLLTAGTSTGLAQARTMYGALGCRIEPAPWDLPGAARRFMRAVRPCAGLIVETELWPNLAWAAHRERIPLGLVSARLSRRSLERYRRWAPALMRETIRAFGGICAQSEADRARFVQLGAAPECVEVAASLKAELLVPPEVQEIAGRWRARWAPHRPVWIAGSTHAGEEAICIAAHQQLLAKASARGAPMPLLVLAPRHPQRFEEVAANLVASGLAFARASSVLPAAHAAEALLVDEMGALLAWYAAGDVAFVGGSLVPVGGHNLLEPASLGKPVLAGPHDANAPDIARRLREAGGLLVVEGAGDLAAALDGLIIDPAAAEHRGACAREAATPDHSGSRQALLLLSRLLEAGDVAVTGRPAARSSAGD